MAALINYSPKTHIYTHINSGASSSIVSADITYYYDLSLLTPRMKTMVTNVFKRGYTNHLGHGMLGNLSRILAEAHRAPFPILTEGAVIRISELTKDNISDEFSLTIKMLGLDTVFYQGYDTHWMHIYLNEGLSTKEYTRIKKVIINAFHTSEEGVLRKATYSDIANKISTGETVSYSEHMNHPKSGYGTVATQI